MMADIASYDGHAAKRQRTDEGRDRGYGNNQQQGYNYYNNQRGGGGRGQEEEKPNHVLLMTILNPAYPITVDVIHTICTPSGKVMRIVIFKKNGVQAMVEFDGVEAAVRAKKSLNGADIYSGCCTLKIEYAKPTRLNVYKNDNDSWDYTNPNLEQRTTETTGYEENTAQKEREGARKVAATMMLSPPTNNQPPLPPPTTRPLNSRAAIDHHHHHHHHPLHPAWLAEGQSGSNWMCTSVCVSPLPPSRRLEPPGGVLPPSVVVRWGAAADKPLAADDCQVSSLSLCSLTKSRLVAVDSAVFAAATPRRVTTLARPEPASDWFVVSPWRSLCASVLGLDTTCKGLRGGSAANLFAWEERE